MLLLGRGFVARSSSSSSSLCLFFFQRTPCRETGRRKKKRIRGRIIRAEMSALRPKERRRRRRKERKDGRTPKMRAMLFYKKNLQKGITQRCEKQRKITLGEKKIFFPLFFGACPSMPPNSISLLASLPPVLICTLHENGSGGILFSIKGESCVRSESLFFSGLDVWEKKGLLTKNSFPLTQVCCLFRERGGGFNPKRRSRGKREKKKGKWGLLCSQVSDALFGAWDSTYVLAKNAYKFSKFQKNLD